ncbi:MAG: hypothetical protein KAH18_09765 [Psychromonas sp.]|nr:hypothetical protein [Psychromonas sp.]
MSIKKQYLKSKPIVKVTFEIGKEAAKDAKKISLVCDHNQWKPVEMQKLKNGKFKLALEFSTANASSYQFIYKAMADTGEYYNIYSEGADEYVDNRMNDGGENAVIRVA